MNIIVFSLVNHIEQVIEQDENDQILFNIKLILWIVF